MNPFAIPKEIFASTFPQDLEPIVALLAEHDIVGQIEAKNTAYDPSFAFSRNADSVRLMVDPNDFDRATAILLEYGYLDDADPDAGLREMLGDLDNDELLELLADASRQPADQVAMARKLLAERGIDPDSEASLAKVEQMVAVEREPKQLSVIAKTLLIILAIGAAPLGLIACVAIALLTATDAAGNKYWLFSKTDRTIAQVVGTIGLVIFLFVMVALKWMQYHWMWGN